jgi:signal transduction histidine kinase
MSASTPQGHSQEFALQEATSAPRHKILVIDDDESSREIARRTLNTEHEVLTAASAAAGFEVLAAQPVDLVLLDVMLPGIRGTEICGQVKSMGQGLYLPVLLVSALHEQESRNEGLASGADDYISKPFDRHELRLRVRTFLRLRDQESTIREQVKKTQQLQELKDDLVSLVAHDLRNPLVGIQGHLDLLKRQVDALDSSALAVRVSKALASTNDLRRILDGMLDVRLLEEQRLPLELESTHVSIILEDAISTLEGAGLAKKVTLRLSVQGEPVARIDRRMTTRAVENLLSNAIRHTKSESEIDVSATVHAERVTIAVADRGEGVQDALKEKMFEKFGSVAARHGGTRRGYGLGLYLVRLVAEAHGGAVSVSDREGGGAVFTLTLPH